MDFNARQYDPQIGRFLGVDPLADFGGQDRYSPYAAMGNMPESTIDPDGLILRMPNPPGYGVKVEQASNDGGGSAGGLAGGALAGVVGNPLTGDISGGMDFGDFGNESSITITNQAQIAAFLKTLGEFAWSARSSMAINIPGGGGSNKDDVAEEPGEEAPKSPNDEEPVKFVNDKSEVLNSVFDNISYKKGDNVFYLMAHDNHGLIMDNSDGSETDFGQRITKVEVFDKHMSDKSPEYKAAIEGNKPFTLWLYVCKSSEMAQKISQAHPNATVIGANGTVHWGTSGGGPAMIGIRTWKLDLFNSGAFIAYKNGQESFRLPYIRTIKF